LFGPYYADIDGHEPCHYQYRSLFRPEDGHLNGMYYNALESEEDILTEVGGVCSSSSDTGSELSATFAHAVPHVFADHLARYIISVPEDFGLRRFADRPTSAWCWYLSEAPLSGLRGLKFCHNEKARILVDLVCGETVYKIPCVGALLFYDDGTHDALGQIRWDTGGSISSHEIPADMVRWRNGRIRGRQMVEWKLTETATAREMEDLKDVKFYDTRDHLPDAGPGSRMMAEPTVTDETTRSATSSSSRTTTSSSPAADDGGWSTIPSTGSMRWWTSRTGCVIHIDA